MQLGQEDNLIRDNQVVHLAQIREQEMANGMANQTAEIVEETTPRHRESGPIDGTAS